MWKILFALTLVLSATGFFLVWQEQSSSRAANQMGGPKTLLDELKVDELVTLRISTVDQDFELKQVDGSWRVGESDWPAESQQVRKLLLALLETKVGDVVTSNPERHPRLELVDPEAGGDGTAKRLDLIDQKQRSVLQLLIGKLREQGDGQYIRFFGEETAFLIAEQLPLEDSEVGWMQKNLFSLGDASIQVLKIETPGGVEYSLEHDTEATDKWKLSDQQAVEQLNTSVVERMARVLGNLEFGALKSVKTPPEEVGRNEVFQVTATASDGRVLEMSIGATEVAEQHWISLVLRSNSDNQTMNQEIELLNQQTEPWIFAISAYSIQALLKDRSALLEQK